MLDLKLVLMGNEHEVIDLETFDFSKVKITFFAAGGKISEDFAEIAAKHSLVIDNSSFYRMDPRCSFNSASGKFRPFKRY